MKAITLLCRILVGLLFVFSGFIKSNDPKGFGIKLKEYFDVFSADLSPVQDSVTFILSDNIGGLVTRQVQLNESLDKYELAINIAEPQEMVRNEKDTYQIVNVFGVLSLGNDNLYQNTFMYPKGNSTGKLLVAAVVNGDTITKNHYNIMAAAQSYSSVVDVAAKLKPSGFLPGFFKSLKDWSVAISIFICVFEIALGFALLFGWKPVLTTWLMLLMILFFTFLTGYSAIFNKVTDCGCFGDFIKLDPWHSFWKDVVLSVLILICFIRKKHIKPLFSPKFNFKAVLFFLLLSTGFSIYCNTFLPVFDFLPYKEGNDLLKEMQVPEGKRESPLMKMVFTYKKGSETKKFEYGVDELPKEADGWEFVSREDQIIEPAYLPPIHDFNQIGNPLNGDITDSILSHNGYKIIVVAELIETSRKPAFEKINLLAKEWKEKEKYDWWALTSSSFSDAEKFCEETAAPYHFQNADNKTLATMIRSSPGVILLYNTTVVKKWSSFNIPTYKQVKKHMK